MKNYDNVTAKELHDKNMEMLNDLGRTGDGCYGVSCFECPFSQENNGKNVGCSELEAEHFDEYVKIIMEYEPKFKLTEIEHEQLKAIKLLFPRIKSLIQSDNFFFNDTSVGKWNCFNIARRK